MSMLEKADEILEDIDLKNDTGLEGDSYFVLKKEEKPVLGVNHLQKTYIAQGLTKLASDFNKKEAYSVMPAGTCFQLVQGCVDDMLNLSYTGWISNRELILSSGVVIPRPRVSDVNGELKYVLDAQLVASEGRLKPLRNSNIVEVKLKSGDKASETLSGAGCFNTGFKPLDNVIDGGLNFDNGLAVPFVKLMPDNKIYISSTSPLNVIDKSFAVFEKEKL
jgi:hypothetical protein